jgi:hypothetical protein
MYINNDREYWQPRFSDGVQIRYGVEAVDGDAAPWSAMEIGSIYVVNTAGNIATWQKVKNDGADNDWILSGGVLIDTVAYTDFTDGGGAAGTYTMTGDIPIGATVVRTELHDITGFTGDTSATIQVGDGSDVDRYSTGTPNVFATAAMVSAGAVSGTAIHTAAVSPVITITSGADWGSVSAGSVTVVIRYDAVA